jgi:hypothetical protein
MDKTSLLMGAYQHRIRLYRGDGLDYLLCGVGETPTGGCS